MGLGSSDFAFMQENRSSNHRLTAVSATTKKRLKSVQPRAAKKISNMTENFINFSPLQNLNDNSCMRHNRVACIASFGSSWYKKKQIKTLYLFLDAVELQHLNDERSCASFVLNGPQQGPHVVHAEGL